LTGFVMVLVELA